MSLPSEMYFLQGMQFHCRLALTDPQYAIDATPANFLSLAISDALAITTELLSDRRWALVTVRLGRAGGWGAWSEKSDRLRFWPDDDTLLASPVGSAGGNPEGRLREGKWPEPKSGSSVGNPGGRLMVGVPGWPATGKADEPIMMEEARRQKLMPWLMEMNETMLVEWTGRWREKKEGRCRMNWGKRKDTERRVCYLYGFLVKF